MVIIITGDIIGSQQRTNQNKWLEPLKEVFSKIGSSPRTWEIYRGDSFQLEIPNLENSYAVAVQIKATIKKVGLDVRMAIGVGEKTFDAPKITESNGEAFVNSGEKFELLRKEKINLAIKTPWSDFDREMNLYFKLALIAMDNWTQKSAELIVTMLENPDLNQQELGAKLGITQASVSQRLQRAFWNEIMEVDAMFREKIKNRAE